MHCRTATVGLILVGLVGGWPRLDAQAPGPLDQAERSRVVTASARILDSLYVDRSLARSMSTFLRAGMHNGRWDRVTSRTAFADSLTIQLRAISHDEHVHVMFRPDDPRHVEHITPEERAHRRSEILESIADENYGIPEVRILPGNVGVLRMDKFVEPRLAANVLAAAMTLINHTRSLIIDLRQNGGGHSDQFVLMMSYFLPEPVEIGETFSRPDSSIYQTWTYAAVPGPTYDVAKPLYVLTSGETFSAAEALAAALRAHRKAVLVGEVTRGGGHMGNFQSIGEGFMMFVATTASTTRDEVEGMGLRPDVAIPAGRALEEAHLLALRAVLPTVKDSTRHRLFEQFERDAVERATVKATP